MSPSPVHPDAPRPGQFLFSRIYGADEDDSLDTNIGSNPVTGEGFIVGCTFAASAGGVVSVFDQTSSGILMLELRQAVIGVPFEIWAPRSWRPFRAGAQVVTSSAVAGMRLIYVLGEVGNLVE